MTAKIDIKTPAGMSLEGFPLEFEVKNQGDLPDIVDSLIDEGIALRIGEPILHSGDIITIEVL